MQGKGVTSRGGASTTTTTTATTTTTTKKHKFLDRVLNAIAKLAEKNGSSAKAIVNYLLKTSGNRVDRNLTLQVQQALKQGVSEGLIQLRGGRYKIRCISRSGTTTGKTAQETAPAVSCTPPQPQPRPTPQAKGSSSSGGGEDRRKNSTDARRRAPRQSSSKADKHDKREKPPVASRTGKTSGSGKSNSHSESSGKSSKKSAPGK